MRYGDEAGSQSQIVAAIHQNPLSIWTSEVRITPKLVKQRIVEPACVAHRVKIKQANTNTDAYRVGKIPTPKQYV
jgi:hypothetical protein